VWRRKTASLIGENSKLVLLWSSKEHEREPGVILNAPPGDHGGGELRRDRLPGRSGYVQTGINYHRGASRAAPGVLRGESGVSRTRRGPPHPGQCMSPATKSTSVPPPQRVNTPGFCAHARANSSRSSRIHVSVVDRSRRGPKRVWCSRKSAGGVTVWAGRVPALAGIVRPGPDHLMRQSPGAARGGSDPYPRLARPAFLSIGLTSSEPIGPCVSPARSARSCTSRVRDAARGRGGVRGRPRA